MTEIKQTRRKVNAKNANVEEKTENVAKQEKRQLKDNDKITVMNNTTGRYGYIGKSGYSFQLEEYGDTAEVPFSELRAMSASKQKRHITDALIIILDEDAVRELNYTKLYENIFDAEGIEKLLAYPDKLRNTLPKMPKIMMETLITIAKQKYKDGQLNNLSVINAIKNAVGVNIMD